MRRDDPGFSILPVLLIFFLFVAALLWFFPECGSAGRSVHGWLVR